MLTTISIGRVLLVRLKRQLLMQQELRTTSGKMRALMSLLTSERTAGARKRGSARTGRRVYIEAKGICARDDHSRRGRLIHMSAKCE